MRTESVRAKERKKERKAKRERREKEKKRKKEREMHTHTHIYIYIYIICIKAVWSRHGERRKGYRITNVPLAWGATTTASPLEGTMDQLT